MNTKQILKIAALLIGAYAVLFYWEKVAGFIGAVFAAAAPLFIGFVIAYLVNILMKVYERIYFPKKKSGFFQKSRRPVSMIGAFVTLIATLSLITSIVIPQLVSCVQLLLSAIPGVFERFLEWSRGLHIFSNDLYAFLENFDWESKIGEIAKMLTNGVGDVMGAAFKVIASVVSGTITIVLSLIFSCYLLASKDRLKRQVRRTAQHYLKPAWYKKCAYIVRTLDNAFHSYIVGQCTEAVILGGLCTLCMLLLRLPYATMIGALIAFTALVPIAGAYIGAGLGAIMILSVSPIKALVFLILIIVLQQLEGNLIYPKVVGASIGLPGIWVLAAVAIGGGIYGILGMLLGVPLAAALYRIIRDDVGGKIPR